MKKLLLLTVITFSAFTTGNAQSTDQTEQVRMSFGKYKKAILNDRDEDAIKYVDSKTIDYYSDILEKTKHADSAEVNTLGILDKLMIFSIRHRTSREDILSFDGEGLFKYAIRKGMVGKSSVAKNEIGDVKIEGSSAKGQLIVNGQASPVYFDFFCEDGIWKINLTSIFPLSEVAFKKMQVESGMDENEFLFNVLEIVSGKKPGYEIWNKIE